MDKNKHFVITINRELGSNGCTIGKLLAAKLGVKYYDKALVHQLTQKFNLTVDEIERIKANKKSWWEEFSQGYSMRYAVDLRNDPNPKAVTTESIYLVESRLLKELASHESCVVMGRSGFHVFRDTPNSLRLFIECTDMDTRLQRVMKKQGLSQDEARKLIEQVDKTRETYTKRFSDSSRYDARNYDLVINTAKMTPEQAVGLIVEALG